MSRENHNTFIPDQPADADHLDFSLYVGALVDQISSPEAQTPMTLGIFGDWGSGKTTLMRLMDREIVARQENGPIRIETLWINVWQLSSQAELWNAFLQSLFNEVQANLSFWRRRRFDWQLLWERVNLYELTKQIALNSYRIIIVIIPLLIALLWPSPAPRTAPTNASQFLELIRNPLAGGTVSLVLAIVLLVKPMVEAARETVSIDLKKILKDPPFKAQVSALQNLQNQFEKMVYAWVGKSGRIVIFIDDLDRCSPDKVTEVLEALKLFATTHGCIYILGADQQVVARAIQIKYKELAGPDGNGLPLDGARYLEKIIQLPFILPLVEIGDITRYLNSFKIDWPHLGVVDSFSRGLPPNPRMIKRAVNVFLLLWRLAEQRKEQKKVGGTITPLRLAKVVALQTAYPDAFERLRDRPELLKGIEELSGKTEAERKASLVSLADVIMSDLVNRPYVVGLFSLQNDDPLALFGKLNPVDLRAFFSLAGQVTVAESETLNPAAVTNPAPESIEISGDIQPAPAVNVTAPAINAVPESAAPGVHQLPPPPRDFAGREHEIEQILNAVEHGASIILIGGHGGTGKTTTALKVAELISPKFPDAQFYIDLRGNSDRTLSPSEAMAHVVRAYYPTFLVTAAESELATTYKSLLHNKSVLLFLDNASTQQQVESLIPTGRCLTLITSRQLFSLPGQVNIILETLSPDAAVALLLSIAPRIGEQAPVIAKLCGYLPLALRLAASTLAERLDVTPEEYARQLAEPGQQGNVIDASIALSYAQLSAESQRLFSYLAVFAERFDREAAARVWSLDPERALELLSELVRYSLLVWDPGTGHYRLHNLVRTFADSYLKHTDRTTSQERHSIYYAGMLQKIDALYLEGGDAIQRSIALYDIESANIRAGQEWAAKFSDESETAAKLCSQYPYAGRFILQLRQHPRERIEWLSAALAASRKLKERRLEEGHLTDLGVVYTNVGEIARGIDCLEEALQISRELSDRTGQRTILSALGVAYMQSGQPSKAIEFYEESLARSREIADKRSESSTLSNLAIAHLHLGDTRRAIELLEQALLMSREQGDRRNEGVTLEGLANAFASLQEYERAIEHYNQGLAISRLIGDRILEGSIMFNLSLSLSAQGNKAEAVSLAENALKIFEEIDHPSAKKVREILADWSEDQP